MTVHVPAMLVLGVNHTHFISSQSANDLLCSGCIFLFAPHCEELG